MLRFFVLSNGFLVRLVLHLLFRCFVTRSAGRAGLGRVGLLGVVALSVGLFRRLGRGLDDCLSGQCPVKRFYVIIGPVRLDDRVVSLAGRGTVFVRILAGPAEPDRR
jgi:hypothetical protein